MVHLFNAVHQFQAAKEKAAKEAQEAKQKAKVGSQKPVAPPKDGKSLFVKRRVLICDDSQSDLKGQLPGAVKDGWRQQDEESLSVVINLLKL